jgi:uncharacterized protein with HEPN domain
MLECIDSIAAYCAAGELASDERTLDAVLRKLQIPTESSKRVSEQLKAAHSEVAWRELAGFRNIVVHDYLGIKLERIEAIVREELPTLREQISAMLAGMSTDSGLKN